MARRLENLFIPVRNVNAHPFVYPPRKMDEPRSPYPFRRNRIGHARSLISKINRLNREIEENRPDDGSDGYYLEFVGEPTGEDQEFKLKLESLEAKNYQIVSYKKLPDGSEKAVVFVPDGKIGLLTNKMNKATLPDDQARNVDFVNSIRDVKLAFLREVWTSEDRDYPTDEDQDYTWEVWIFNEDSTLNKFLTFCDLHQITVIPGVMNFVDRKVLIVRCSAATLSNVFQYQKIICELRKPADTAYPIIESSPFEQQQWAESLNENLNVRESNTELWILDCGVSRNNPLIAQFLPPANALTVNPNWPTYDDPCLNWRYHGSLMAGVGIYGDLLKKLLSNSPVEVKHSIGSVRILPPRGRNQSENYPFITQQAVALSEIFSNKQKIYCMAVTDPELCKRGESTAWSASIDLISSSPESRNLFVLSGGNVNHDAFHPRNYPAENELTSIHDPAQAWNALTVGAYTNLDTIQEPNLMGSFQPVARRGQLSPRSTTSLEWGFTSDYQIKPDVVFEGGNIALNPQNQEWDEPASLGVLSTTGAGGRVFDYFLGTSSATAYAANMAAEISARYPSYWPETIRALIVHSANWTNEMLEEFATARGKDRIHGRLRKYGFGVPDLDRALACAQNEVTLISQSYIRPFQEGASSVTYNECHVIDLPWPTEVLRQLGNTLIKLKVTLSYFIEPNPSRRGEIGKYQYASHGLRFRMIAPTEGEQSFLSRISAHYRNEPTLRVQEDNANWSLGPDLRTRGSIHSDIWEGRAADLAQKSKLAIIPVGGWWKDYKGQRKWDADTRYSLIVSIEAPENANEIYNAVRNAITATMPVPNIVRT